MRFLVDFPMLQLIHIFALYHPNIYICMKLAKIAFFVTNENMGLCLYIQQKERKNERKKERKKRKKEMEKMLIDIQMMI